MNLSIFEQSPRLREVYTQLCFCYALSNASSQTAIIATLIRGLERLTASFPWVAGQVINEGASEGNTGTYTIAPFGVLPQLVIKDLTNDHSAPRMHELRAANFPFSMLDEKVICPRMTLGGGEGETMADATPVLLLQANFVDGGLLLCIVASHSVMDIVGQVQMIHLLSKTCQDEAFSDDEVKNGNLDRRNLISIPEDTKQDRIPTASNTNTNPPLHPVPDEEQMTQGKLAWAYITFSYPSLVALKALASSSTTAFVSTDDALSALLWQVIARSRLARLSPDTESLFNRNVDLRPYFSIPSSYPGNLSAKTRHSSTLGELAEQSLGAIATQLRSALDPDPLKQSAYNEARTLAGKKDKSSKKQVDRSKTIVLSSWAKTACYGKGLDFGLGMGEPVAVRRPRFREVEGVVYFLPRSLEGEIAVGVCLRCDDLENLMGDEGFGGFGRWVG